MSLTARYLRRHPGLGPRASVPAGLMGCFLMALLVACAPPHAVRDVRLPSEVVALDGADLSPLSTRDLTRLLERRHIYVGERHGGAAFHTAQWQVLKVVRELGPVAVGVEWLNRDQQSAVDAFLGGAGDWKAFDRAVSLSRRWGEVAANQHRPILEWCREHRIPIVALNAPEGLSRAVARNGPQGVPPHLALWLPALDTGNAAHRRYFSRLMSGAGGHHGGAHRMTDAAIDRYYRAQLVWDESMARAVVAFLRTRPGYRMVVFAGLGHVEFGHGIPLRAQKWLDGEPFTIIRPLGADESSKPAGRGAYPNRSADMFWRVR